MDWQLKILVVVADTANTPSPSPLFATGWSKVFFSLKSEKDCDYITQTILQKTPYRHSFKYLFINAKFIYMLTKITKKSAKVTVPRYTFRAQYIEKLPVVLEERSGPDLWIESLI